MKKIIPSLIVLFFAFSVSAQYKKASFFGKSGRTYEIGSQMYFLGDGKGSPIGYRIGFGRDQDGRQLFSSWDIQFIPSYKYSYTTTNSIDESVSVNGRTAGTWIYGWNLGYHLLKNESGSQKVKPYVTLGLDIVMVGGSKEENSTISTYDVKRQTQSQTFSGGLTGGLGCVFNLSSKLGLKVQGGYTAQGNVSSDSFASDVSPYYLFTSHPYASIGLRLRIVQD
ncbi:MAG: hypothetical protein ACJ75B_20280 [Flavisolibacter sp.]